MFPAWLIVPVSSFIIESPRLEFRNPVVSMASLPRIRKPRPAGAGEGIIAELAERIPVHPEPGNPP
jgi:hypothetical protein